MDTSGSSDEDGDRERRKEPQDAVHANILRMK